jgi:hypothetical protein
LYDNNGKLSTDTKQKILSELGFDNWCSFDDLDELHIKKANKENLKLIDLENPLDVDNHKLHIEQHIKYIISENSNEDDHKNKILEHIKIHKEYLNKDK